MTDQELGAEICPEDPARGAILVAEMSPDTRAKCERLIATADELNLWAAGLGPKPKDVIACGRRQIRKAGRA